MATDRHYRPGSFYRIDARTGFAERAERTRKEWTGQLVRERSWEPRHPQDFVRGTTDNETVPEPRPRMPEMFVSNAVTDIAADAVLGGGIGHFVVGITPIGTPDTITVLSAFGWQVDDIIWIMQDNGDYWVGQILEIDGSDVVFAPPLIRAVSTRNQVVNYSAQQRAAGALFPGGNGWGGDVSPADFGPDVYGGAA